MKVLLISPSRSRTRKGSHQTSRGSSLLSTDSRMAAHLQTTTSTSQPFIWSSVSLLACRFL
ncbi:hypothetical protein AB3S75_017473 [Citrus x aurantiifolia]